MRETVLQLNSSYLENERCIWICEPESVSGALGRCRSGCFPGRRCPAFQSALLARGHAVRYNEFDRDHDYACWNKTLVDALKWGGSLQPAEHGQTGESKKSGVATPD